MYPKFIFQDVRNEKQESERTQSIQRRLHIRAPDIKPEGVQLSAISSQILLPSFVTLILGKPGSGKSHLINEMLDQQDFYSKKFDRIIYMGPTKYPSCIHDKYNTNSTFSTVFLDKKIQQCQQWASNMLIVLDDVVSQLPTVQKSRAQQLFFNRRHQLKNGTISMIVTSQKYTSVPTWIRATVNSIFCFGISKNQIKTLLNEIPIQQKSQIVYQRFSNMPKHGFLYFNLEKGKIYDSEFDLI